MKSLYFILIVQSFLLCLFHANGDGGTEITELEQFQNVSDTENAILPWKEASDDLDTWEAPYEIRKNYPYYLSGYDPDGRPIWIGEIGKWNFRKAIEAGPETMRNLKKHMEQASYRILKARQDKSTPESPVDDSILIGDFDEFNIFQLSHLPTMQFIIQWAAKYRNAITGHLHVCLVLNTNSIATTLVNVLKPVFGGLVEKAEIYGTNKAKWIPQVLKHCPKDQVPEWYGGSKSFIPVKVYG